MSLSKKYILVGLVLMVAFMQKANAQVSIEVKLDTNMLLIGDQTNFSLQATFPKDVQINFPVFSDTIIGKLEVLNILAPDTVFTEDAIKLTQSYLVTSFDSGWYEIPPLDFEIIWSQSNVVDSAKSNPIYFGVVTMPIDTANANAITDIKAPLGAPVSFKEVLPFLLGFLAYIVLFFIGYVIYKRFFKKEPLFVKKEKPKEPAHLIALRDLDFLKEQKLWQAGKNKAYHSELTDIVRNYIENRYAVFAMEQTTDETMAALKAIDDVEQGLKSELYEVLSRADFVKFAKASTMPDENEKSLEFAYRFVLKTKYEPNLNADENKGDENEDGRTPISTTKE